MESITDPSRNPTRLTGSAFYHLIAGAPCAVCAVDSQLRLREASARARRMFGETNVHPGHDLAEVIRGTWTEGFASEVVRLMRDALASGEAQEMREAAAPRDASLECDYYDVHCQRATLPGGGMGVVAYFLEATERVRALRLLAEQTRLLRDVARNRSQEECLVDITACVARLHPPLRAGVLVSNAERTQVQAGYSACLPASFFKPLRGAPVERMEAKQEIESWPQWRETCSTHGIRAARSMPSSAEAQGPAAWFFIGLAEARAPSAWELQLASFGSEMTALAMQREQAVARVRKQRWEATEDLAAIRQLHALSMRMVRGEDLRALLDDILLAATEFTGTEQGNIQFLDSASGKLRIVAHRGFSDRFLAYFAESGWAASCESAATMGQRVIVEDVLQLPPGSVSEESLEVVLGEGVRAIQSTPLVSRDGRLLGMLSSHFREPHRPGDRELRLVDLLARQAADLIERRRPRSILPASG